MNEMTPETAKAYIGQLLRDGIIGVLQQAVLIGIVSAWEADIEERDDLRKRLEEMQEEVRLQTEHSVTSWVVDTMIAHGWRPPLGAIITDLTAVIAELREQLEKARTAVSKFEMAGHKMDDLRTWHWDDACFGLHVAFCNELEAAALAPPGPKEAGKEEP